MRDREKERTQTVAGKGAMQTSKQNTLPCLVMEGWHTNGTVMVGQYTQTRQRELRVKTVKSSHDKHYKKRILP